MTDVDMQKKGNNNQYSPQVNEFTRKLAKILVEQIKHDLEVKKSRLKITSTEAVG